MRLALAKAILADRISLEQLKLYAWLSKDSNVIRQPFGFFQIDMSIASAELLWSEREVDDMLRSLVALGVVGWARENDLWYFA